MTTYLGTKFQNIMAICFLSLFLVQIFQACDFLEDLVKTCDQPLIHNFKIINSEFKFQVPTKYDSDQSSYSYYYFTVHNICPEKSLEIKSTLNTTGTTFENEILSVRLEYYYRIGKKRYKDYTFLTKSQENPNQWINTTTLTPSSLGFSIETSVNIGFYWAIYPLNKDDFGYTSAENYAWLSSQVNDLDIEITGTKF